MKIKDLMSDIFKQDILNGSSDLTLYSKDLEKIKDQLIKLDEFKDVSELIVLEIPHVEDMEGNPVEVISMRLDDNVNQEKFFNSDSDIDIIYVENITN